MASMVGATPSGPTKTYQFKLVLLGDSAVGKSSLVLRFAKGRCMFRCDFVYFLDQIFCMQGNFSSFKKARSAQHF